MKNNNKIFLSLLLLTVIVSGLSLLSAQTPCCTSCGSCDNSCDFTCCDFTCCNSDCCNDGCCVNSNNDSPVTTTPCCSNPDCGINTICECCNVGIENSH